MEAGRADDDEAEAHCTRRAVFVFGSDAGVGKPAVFRLAEATI